MKKPPVQVLERTSGTFLEFLTRENFLPLMPLFITAHTVQGYGYLDEVIMVSTHIHIVPQGVGSLRFDLEHSPVCCKHITEGTEARQISLQRLCPQARI